ncbi:MAG TPA: hypothetical protein PLN69_05845 [bacterium]|nr:hypothetical protein [bacterium]
MRKFNKKKKFERKIEKLPVYEIEYFPGDEEWIKNFAANHLNLTGEIEFDKADGKQIFELKTGKWWFSYEHDKAKIVLRNMDYYEKHSFEAESKRNERISASLYKGIAVDALKEFRIFDDNMVFDYLGLPVYDSDFPSVGLNCVIFKKAINGFETYGNDIDAEVCISNEGDIIRISKYMFELEEYGDFPLKTPEEAYDDFRAGNGMTGLYLDTKSDFEIDDIEIGYYFEKESPCFVQPVYIFRGTGQMGIGQMDDKYRRLTGITEAISGDYYLKEDITE